jgi:chitodextrinase
LDVASTTYTAEGLTPGTYYEFKVESRNSYGYSVFSEVLTLLAAYKPEAPGAPTTTTINDYVEISWPAAVDNGSPIIGHRVYI